MNRKSVRTFVTFVIFCEIIRSLLYLCGFAPLREIFLSLLAARRAVNFVSLW
jgi:hypothetical protein